MDDLNSSDLTTLLAAWKSDGDTRARDRAFELAEKDLLAIARRAAHRQQRRHGQVEPGELLSELYVRLADHPANWDNRAKFYAMACVVVRNVLLDIGRRDRAAKRPPTALRMTESALAGVAHAHVDSPVERIYTLLARYAAIDARAARVLELFDIAGVSIADVAGTLGISEGTVKRDLLKARGWVRAHLG